MSHTQILFRDDARAKLLAGASTLADAVRVTSGETLATGPVRFAFPANPVSAM